MNILSFYYHYITLQLNIPYTYLNILRSVSYYVFVDFKLEGIPKWKESVTKQKK